MTVAAEIDARTSPAGGPVEPAVLAEIARLAARALARWDESRHPRRPAGSAAGGEFAPGTYIGLVEGGAIEVVDLGGADPMEAEHAATMGIGWQERWHADRFRYDRGVVYWNDEPEDDSYWAVENRFGAGLRHEHAHTGAPIPRPDPPYRRRAAARDEPAQGG